MSAGLLLDALLVLVVALYVPIGAWRGGVREAALGGALVLGAATAFAWAPNWGERLADSAGTSESTGRFLTAVVILAVVGLGLGFAGGVVAQHGTPEPLGRAAGAVLGALNVTFALASFLSFVTVYLPSGRPNRTVEEGLLAEWLASGAEWLLLLAVPLYAAVTIAYRLTLRFDDDVAEQPAELRGAVPAGPRRARSVGLPHDPDGGKVEPPSSVPVPDGRGRSEIGGLGRVTRELVPPALVPADLARPANLAGSPTWTERERADRSVADQPFPTVSTVVDDWLRRAAENVGPRAASEAGQGTTPRPPVGGPENPDTATSFTGAAYSALLDPRSSSKGAPKRERRSRRSDGPPTDQRVTWGTEPGRSQDGKATGSDAMAPIRRCPVCGTPAVSELERCPFCGGGL